jgi:AcrR family transcriptional regulator
MESDGSGPDTGRTARRSVGSRLDRTKDQAIIAAVVDVLARLGFTGFTMDEVAVSAGVGKGAIYRRWAGKTDLLAGYIEGSLLDTLDVRDTGSLGTDLVALLTSAVAHFNGPAGRANRALLSAVHEDATLAAAYHAGPAAQWRTAFDDVLRRAADRGEIEPTAGASLAAEAGAAILVQRWLLLGAHIDGAVVTAVVDEVVLPLLRSRGERPLPEVPAPGTSSSERRGEDVGG